MLQQREVYEAYDLPPSIRKNMKIVKRSKGLKLDVNHFVLAGLVLVQTKQRAKISRGRHLRIGQTFIAQSYGSFGGSTSHAEIPHLHISS